MLSVIYETDPEAEGAVSIDVVGVGPHPNELTRLAARQMPALARQAKRRAWPDRPPGTADVTGQRSTPVVAATRGGGEDGGA